MCALSLKNVLAAMLALALVSSLSAGETRPDEFVRVRDRTPTPFPLVEQGQPAAEIVVSSPSELVRNAADWLAAFVRDKSGAELKMVKAAKAGSRRLVVAVGEDPGIAELQAAGLKLDPRVGPEGFVLQRVSDPDGGEVLVCWSPAELGCRYGLIEILRSLQVRGQDIATHVARVVDRPQFPVRICYVNFAEHLQNAFNPNVLFDVPVNRWSRADWERFIDMVSAFRYNVFEFWLVPTLFSPEALRGGKIQTEFADTINHVIAYAKRRGVAVHPIQAVNTVGQQWHYHCPHVPAEHAEIVALWDHWSRAMQGNELIGFFPGDPGGCFQNGCTAETYVDLCLELARSCGRTTRVSDRGRHVGRSDGRLGRAPVDRQTGAGRTGDEVLPEQAAPVPARHVHQHQPGLQPGLPSDQPRRRRTALRPRGGQDAHRPDLGLQRDRRRGNRFTAVPRAADARAAARGVGPGLLFGRHLLHDGAAAPVPEHLLLCRGVVEPVAHARRRAGGFRPVHVWRAVGSDRPVAGGVRGDSRLGILPAVSLLAAAAAGEHDEAADAVGAGRSRRVAPVAAGARMAEYRQSLLFYADLFHKLAAVATAVDELNSAARASGKFAADRQEPVSLEEAEAAVGHGRRLSRRKPVWGNWPPNSANSMCGR